MPTTSRTTKIVAWTPAILVCLFLILASAAPKLFLAYPGSPLEAFSKELGLWDIQVWIGIVELAAAVLFLIPRTATVGFVLLVGLLGGALATILTHSSQTAMPGFPVGMLALLMLSAYFRCPELLTRIMGKTKKHKQRLATLIAGWLPVVLIVFMNLFSAYMKFALDGGLAEAKMMMDLGAWDIRIPLGILQVVICVLWLIPRTSTWGFILMVGYMGGAWATNLTHGMISGAVVFWVFFGLMTLSAWFRNPELTWRIRNLPVKA